jgi:hypothetical protein
MADAGELTMAANKLNSLCSMYLVGTDRRGRAGERDLRASAMLLLKCCLWDGVPPPEALCAALELILQVPPSKTQPSEDSKAGGLAKRRRKAIQIAATDAKAQTTKGLAEAAGIDEKTAKDLKREEVFNEAANDQRTRNARYAKARQLASQKDRERWQRGKNERHAAVANIIRQTARNSLGNSK